MPMEEPASRRAEAIAVLERGLTELCAQDADLGGIVAAYGPPPFSLRETGFAALLRAIVAQQVSTASAQAVWSRLARAADPIGPDSFLALSDDAIRACGFSRQKTAYGRGLAEAVASGRLDLAGVEALPDEEAVAALTVVKGVGRWSAEVYLLLALGRPDVFPAQDLALIVAAQRLKGLPERPSPAALRELAEAWRPWRGVAAILLWHYYLSAVRPIAGGYRSLLPDW